MSRRLRCQGFVVQPVVVWDDGEELSPGPQLNPVQVSSGGLQEFVDRWPGDFAEFREKLENDNPTPTEQQIQ